MSISRKITTLYTKTAVLSMRLIWKSKDKSNECKGKLLTNYFTQKYLPIVENIRKKNITTESQEVIWQFWDNPDGKKTPPIIKSCLDSVDKYKGNFEHKILNNLTIKNYSDLPGYILDRFNKKQMDYAHFSDLLRLNLLKNHGGIWLDATGFMTNFIPKYIVDEVFFVFLTGKLTIFPYSFMQNCFIRAKKGSFLCEAWYEMCLEYWKKEKKELDYFQHQLMFKALVEKNPTAKDLFDKMPKKPDDEIHQLVGNNLFKKFDEKKWGKIKKTSFFQKTTYRTAGATDLTDTYFSKLSEGNL